MDDRRGMKKVNENMLPILKINSVESMCVIDSILSIRQLLCLHNALISSLELFLRSMCLW